MTIRKILVPVDFSGSSTNALQFAATFAAKFKASIHLLHVIDNDYDLFGTGYRLKPLRFRETIQQLGILAMSVLNEYQVKCFYTTEYGSVTHNILKNAVNLNTDMIVMGKNGSNGMMAAYAGTHTSQMAEKTKIPLFIVPENIVEYKIERMLLPIYKLSATVQQFHAMTLLAHLERQFFGLLLPVLSPDNNDDPDGNDQPGFTLQSKLEQQDINYSMEYYSHGSDFSEKVLACTNNKEQAFDLVVVNASSNRQNPDFNTAYYPQKIVHACTIPILVLNT
ncbi:MAG: universal stress protein [Chitinophagaceae bacterium]